VGDLLVLNYFFVFNYCHHQYDVNNICGETTPVVFFIFLNLTWIVLSGIVKTGRFDRQAHKKQIMKDYTVMVIIFFFAFLLFFQITSFSYYPRNEIKLLFILFYTSLLLWQFLLYFSLAAYRKLGYNYRNVVIVGYNDHANELKKYFNNNPWTGYHFKGFFTHQESHKKDVIGTYDDLFKYTIDHHIDEIYIMNDEVHESIYNIISSIISRHPVKIRIVPDLSHFSNMSISLVNYDIIPILKVESGPLNFWYNRLIKRSFDVLFSLVVIIVILSWLIPLLALVDLIMGREGLFFIQKRTGINGRTFNLIKFKTMINNKFANIAQATKDDNRVTKIGRFLRRTSIDELPQFFNVLIGDMSVVGPRPHMLVHTDLYKEIVKSFMIRHSIKPGLTGYAQVRGYRGEIKRTRDIKNRIKMDLYYIENWSIFLDIKIIFLTFYHFLKGEETAY
jgi:Undecaprenyl-phosphate glucose phosphotransferase